MAIQLKLKHCSSWLYVTARLVPDKVDMVITVAITGL